MACRGSDKNRGADGTAERQAVCNRRAALRGISALALLAAVTPAVAQTGNWPWDRESAVRNAKDEASKKADALNDLRPNSVPYRSDAMIEAIEGAINRYQVLSEKGGWPMIPGSKMIRPEDDDDRVPALRRSKSTRLNSSHPRLSRMPSSA